MLIYHILAFITGFVLDLFIGDPHSFPHPVRFIGKLIEWLEKLLYKGRNLVFTGIILTCCTICITGAVSAIIFAGTYIISPILGFMAESIMTYQILSVKSLRTESMKVYKCLITKDVEGARAAVSMIVGRDTSVLDETGIIKAAIETVAENTSDGVIAPMLYLALGGPVSGFIYKAVNTMDSMIGYRNEKYMYFGKAAAKLDDVLNFIPSRISACFMIMAAFIMGKEYDGKNAFCIFVRDRKNHASPNSAQTESAAAGALKLRLSGDAVYFGKIVQKPFIGDALKPPEAEDIKRVNRLMYVSAGLCEAFCVVLMLCCWRLF